MQTHSYFQSRDVRRRRPRRIVSFTGWLQIAILAISVQNLIAAPGPVSAVQEALKQEQLFAGEANGILDENTQSALRNFQLRKGLPITGEIDAGTLQALENSTRTPQAMRLPIESVPPSGKATDSTLGTAEKDRAFLETLNTHAERVPATIVPAQPPPPLEPRVAVLSLIHI